MKHRSDARPRRQAATARDRLLLNAARLLDAAHGDDVSTRAILEAAGVQAPTLYHHFGSKQGLLDAVVTHGFKAYLAARPKGDRDALAAIREGWDTHVQFGVAHPYFYVHVYGHVRPGDPCGVIADVEAMVRDALLPAATEGRLRVPPTEAAKLLVAASAGVTLTLINQADGSTDLTLSERAREAVVAAIAIDAPDNARAAGHGAPVSSAAIALAAALEGAATQLEPAEVALMRDWLDRLAAPAPR